MHIYTRTGDTGMTSLLDGSRVPKDDPHVEACGALDELGSWLGLSRVALCELPEPSPSWQMQLLQIQGDLLTIGAALADPAGTIPASTARRVGPAEVARLEAWIDELEINLPPLHSFILLGGHEAAARLHVARSVCRRAERRVISLRCTRPVDTWIISYLNRLSDYLFVLARSVNRLAGMSETEWKG
ncbi:MAG: cob(I)yrinic acid a,c-diamide adenosyltransferase [Limnochordales bacterium]|nr:cob(I)yrinic acid a,c-diamide adenosyltransferase [Limnochordales bacterium]